MNSHATVRSSPHLPSTIQGVLAEARGLFPRYGIGLQLSTKGVLRTVAATESSIWRISDGIDMTHDGPEYAPLWKDDACCMINIATDHHWPAWGARVSRLGWRSLLAIRLVSGDPASPVPSLPHTIGAVVLYSHAVSRWAADLDPARAFAAHAQIALIRSGAVQPRSTR